MSVLTSSLAFVRKHKWKILIGLVVLMPIAAIAAFALTPKQPEYVTAVAEEGDIRQTVEAVGTVISDRDLELQFPSPGIVAAVYVKEGDTVAPGQKLAQLRASNLGADIASAQARVAQAVAELNKVKEGTRQEDIAITEAEIQNKRASLEAAKVSLNTAKVALEQSQQKLTALENEAIVSLSGYVSGVGSSVTKEVTAAENALSAMSDILSEFDVADAVIKYESSDYNDLILAIGNARKDLSALYSKANPQDYVSALALLDETRQAVSRTMTIVNWTFTVIDSLPVTSYFTESARQTYKNEIITQRSILQTSLNTLDSSAKSLRDASANFTTRIIAEKASVSAAQGTIDKAGADIITLESTIRIAEAQLQLKKAPTRQTDIAIAQAAVSQARAALSRAQADYSNTVLTSPIAGKVTKVNVKVGEYAPLSPAVTMLGNSPYRVEMYVSEIDVPKLSVSQDGFVELDAFPGVDYDLKVSEIDSASTDRDGVPKYRVRLDFVYPHDEFRIGMTGDAEVVTGTEEGVVTVPLRAVLEADDGSQYVRVMNDDGEIEERSVQTGLEGEGGLVTVEGVKEGEVIVVLEKD